MAREKGAAITMEHVDVLAKQLEDLAKREQKADPKEVFVQRKETAFSELN